MSDTLTIEEQSLRQRVETNPTPAMLWFVGVLILTLLEFGALLQVLVQLLNIVVTALQLHFAAGGLTAAGKMAADVPTFLSRKVISNQGYQPGGTGPWTGTFMGIEPKWAWFLRVVLIYGYAFAWLGWVWYGYLTFRRHYRYADWTPRDDVVDRLRHHRWGMFGFVVVFMFVVMAVFAPALGTATLDQNILHPYDYNVHYWDASTGQVASVPVGIANIKSKSQGAGGNNVGLWSYDDFGRFHPFGTLVSGKDLFTFIAHGARISLLIGVTSMGLAAFLAITMATLTAYYKGLVDLFIVVTSDSVQALPLIMILILMVVIFSNTWIADVYNGALLLIIIFTIIYWPYLWRAVRGPALQISEEEWIDAAKSFGQRPRAIMRKHMSPYIIGYMLVYASLSLGGVIIATAGLTFLGLGINPPTPEWGRAINAGQPYVATASWHISLIPGLLITLVVTAFNALGDGIRDAVDPQSETGEAEATAATAGGGGA